MYRMDEDDKRYRSIKLCQLVYDRRIDSEIDFELRKLLEEGVLIDFRDQNRNGKTALHLAVEKGDVTCVKFLLRCKPSLEVNDRDGKTPVELAISKGDNSILNVLMNSTFDVVIESFVEVFDYESLTRQKIEAIKSRSTFKVLKLINCPSVNYLWMKLSDDEYATTLNESSHLFFIAIETKEPNTENDHELMKKVLNLRRPMIVQLSSSNSQITKIYFSDNANSKLVEITDTPQITREDFDRTIQSDECNMRLLVAALRSNQLGPFTGNLLDTKMSTNEDRSEAVNQFARKNALCHRFFKLFGESQPQIDRIVAALSFKGDQSLLALLDLPFELKDEKLKLTEYQQDILDVVDSRDYNLLMMAAEQGNLDAVKLLLRCGCDFNYCDYSDKHAVDICWDVKAFDCLAELIEAGSPYPINFSTDGLDDSSEALKRINVMIEVIKSFHSNIEQGEIEEVKKFITSHPHIKHAYDSSNKCALTVALQSSQIDMYSLLLSEEFEPGVDDEYQEALNKSQFKNEIRNSHRKYFKEAFKFKDPHLKRLLEKSKLSLGNKEKDRENFSKIIQRMFDEVNEIDEVIPILKSCSISEKLQIVFDFNCDSTKDMDPTSGWSSSSVAYPNSGFVYIGAKNHETDFYKVIGTLIHELTHYAMKLTYENECKPYDDDDHESEDHFEKITKETEKICEENPSADPIVKTVFTCYSQRAWHQELIVRVPQLLAQHKMNSKALEAAERNTPELFLFYRQKTLKDVATQDRSFLQKPLIIEINNKTEIFQKIENLNVQFEYVDINLKPSVNIITSNAPQLTMAMLAQVFQPDSNIFVSLEQVESGNILDKIAKINTQKVALIVDCIGLTQEYPECLRKLIENYKNMKTIALVMTETESSIVKENFSNVELKTFPHKWDELTDRSSVTLLRQSVLFQGVEMELNKLVEPPSEAMNFFPLGEIFNNYAIGETLHQPFINFYIERKFIQKDQKHKTSSKSFEELTTDNPKISSMIISDEAGTGKSVTLYEIAKSLHETYPDRWVLFVELKRYIGACKRVEDYEKIKSFEDFVLQNILQPEPKFDRELFVQMFREGKTFVLFDGFDEISPNFKNLLLHVLKFFEPGSGNQLFITTRPHLEADLEIALGSLVFKLEEFSDEIQIRFLTKYWQSVVFETSLEDYETLSKRLLEKFSKISSSNNVGLPLLLRMTAEIFDDPSKKNLLHKVDSLSIASIFREFVDKYLARWLNNKNEIALKILEIHHRIAIKHIFGEKFTSLDVDESDAEKISRVGLVRYDNTEKTFQFINETFAQYFVADFIWFHLNRKNRNPSHDCRMAIAIELLIDISLVSKKIDVIKTFLDQILEAMKFTPNEALCKSVAKCLSEVLKSKNCYGILRESLIGGHENIASLLISVAKYADQEVLLKILNSESEGDSTLLTVVAYGNRNIVSTLCDLITSLTDNPKEMYQHKGQFGNVLLNAARNQSGGVLTTLCTSLNSVLTRDEIKIMFQQKDKDGQNVAIASNNSTDMVFLELLSVLPNYLSRNEIKLLLRSVNSFDQNFFDQAVTYDSNESLKLKFEVVKSYFNSEDLKTLFYQPATVLNVFFRAAQNRNEKIFETLIEYTRDVVSNDEIRFMLMQKDSQGSNVLHIVAEQGNEIKLNELNLLLRKYLTDDDIRSLLLQVNEKGQNCFRIVADNTRMSLQFFCETIGNLISNEDQTRMLLESDREIDAFRLISGQIDTKEIITLESMKEFLTKENLLGRNIFHEVAAFHDVGTWNDLVSFTQKRFSIDEMKKTLLSCSKGGENCLHLAASRNDDENLIVAIFETNATLLNDEEQIKFLRQKDNAKKNVFHSIAESQNRIKLYSLFDCLNQSKILTKEEIKAMLLEKDSDDNNIFLCSLRSQYGYPKALYDLITFSSENLSKDEIKTLLFDEDCEGRTCLHYAVEEKPKSVIKFLTKSLKTILSPYDEKKLFGNKSQNIFRVAVKNPNEKIFSTLLECLKGVFANDEIKQLIQEEDSDGNNILLSICQRRTSYSDEDNLQDFLEILKDTLDAKKLKHFLTSSNKHGSNCLLLACKFKDKLFLEKLFIFVQTELSIEEQRNVIQNYDREFNNIFSYAAYNDIPTLLTVKAFPLLKLFYETLPVKAISDSEKSDLRPSVDSTLAATEKGKVLLESTDVEGWSKLHHACESATLQEVQQLCEDLAKQLSKKNLLMMIMMQTHGFKFTPLMLAASNEERGVLEYFWKFIKHNVDDVKTQEILRQGDCDKNTFLRFALQRRNEENFQTAMNILKSTVEIGEVKSLVLAKNINGDNIWLDSFPSEIFEEKLKRFWSYLPKIFDNKTMKEILTDAISKQSLPESIKRRILFHSGGIIEFVAKTLDDRAKKDIEFNKRLIAETKQCSIDTLKLLIGQIPSLKQIFLEKDEKSQNIFHFAVLNKDPEVLRFLVSKAKFELGPEELSNVLKAQDDLHRNIILKALTNSNKSTLNTAVEIIKELLPDDFQSMLQDVDAAGQNMLHYACAIREFNADTNDQGRKSVVETVAEILKTNLNEELSLTLLKSDLNGKSAFYYATYEDFQFLKTFFLNYCSDAEFANLMNQDDSVVNKRSKN